MFATAHDHGWQRFPRVGEVKLVAGTASLTIAGLSANSLVLLSKRALSGTFGNLSYTITGNLLTITSSSSADTANVIYCVFL